MTEKLKALLKRTEPWQAIVAIILGIVGAMYGAMAWVRTSAQNVVLEEKFLGTFAARIRPVCIFDSRGTMLADLGAGEYVQDIQVTPVPKIYGFEVVINAKRHLAYAPLVSAMNVDLFTLTSTRERLNDWKVLLAPQTTINATYIAAAGPTEMDTNSVYQFKLEILH
jgi:hypothetical protein